MATQAIKDILNSEQPSPSYGLIPTISTRLTSEMSFSRSGAARQFDPRASKFTTVSGGNARIYGERQALMFEAAPRTNYCGDSSKFSNWSGASTLGASDGQPSIIGGENASRISGDGGFTALRNGAGSFSSSPEVLYTIVEKDTANPSPSFSIRTIDTNNFNSHGSAKLDTTDGTVVLQDGLAAFGKVITRKGPNGGTVWLLEVRYDPSNDGVGGVNRKVDVFPDQNGNDDVYLHHAQLEENYSSSSPIVTTTSTNSRPGESLSVSAGDWWNGQEGTFYLEIQPLTIRWYNEFDNPIALVLAGASDWLRLRSGTPFGVECPAAGIDLLGAAEAYQYNKIALSFHTDGTAALASNGTVTTTTSGGGAMTSKGNVVFGRSSALIASISSFQYIPKELPATEADRSAGDPISLESLTV